MASDTELIWSKPYWPIVGNTLKQQSLAVKRYRYPLLLPPNPIIYGDDIYVLLRQERSSGGFDAMVAKIDGATGALDTNFGTLGFKQLPTDFPWMGAATFGPPNVLNSRPTRAYFSGTKRASGTAPRFFMAVACFDFTASNGKCSDWPSDSISTVAFNLAGPPTTEFATAIEYDPADFLFVAGDITAPGGRTVGIAKLFASSGALVTSFGSQSGRETYDLNGTGSSAPHVKTSAFATADMPGGKRFLIGGSYQHGSDPDDRDGFVLSIDPQAATYFPADVHAEDDNTGYKIDEVTALTVLKTGAIAYAGWSETDDVDYPTTLLGGFTNFQLTPDPKFCGSGLCSHEANDRTLAAYRIVNVRPRAIAERPKNQDLVLALDGIKRENPMAWDYLPRQMLQVWNRSGMRQRSTKTINYTASNDDNIGAWSNALEVTDDYALLAGKRRWSATDDDITVAIFEPEDSIFAADFGGAHSN